MALCYLFSLTQVIGSYIFWKIDGDSSFSSHIICLVIFIVVIIITIILLIIFFLLIIFYLFLHSFTSSPSGLLLILDLLAIDLLNLLLVHSISCIGSSLLGEPLFLLAFLPYTHLRHVVLVSIFSLAVHFIPLEASFVLCTVGPSVETISVLVVMLPFSEVLFSVSVSEGT